MAKPHIHYESYQEPSGSFFYAQSEAFLKRTAHLLTSEVVSVGLVPDAIRQHTEFGPDRCSPDAAYVSVRPAVWPVLSGSGDIWPTSWLVETRFAGETKRDKDFVRLDELIIMPTVMRHAAAHLVRPDEAEKEARSKWALIPSDPREAFAVQKIIEATIPTVDIKGLERSRLKTAERIACFLRTGIDPVLRATEQQSPRLVAGLARQLQRGLSESYHRPLSQLDLATE